MPVPVRKTGTFTYGDYAAWPADERWELIEGVAYDMTPAPTRAHQKVAGELFVQLVASLKGSPCEVYQAPFDVRLPEGDEADAEVVTVVQPDVLVVCSPEKLDERGCRGAPDFVIEVLSPSTAAKDQREKVSLYERHGVREYWVVDSANLLVTVRCLRGDGAFGPPTYFGGEGTLAVTALPGVRIDLAAVFAPATGARRAE